MEYVTLNNGVKMSWIKNERNVYIIKKIISVLLTIAFAVT